jgi:hypothetical protein
MPVLSAVDRFKKLRGMTAAEVVERLRHKGLLATERALHRRGRLHATRSLDRVLRPDLRGSAGRDQLWASRSESRRRFFAGTLDRGAMASLFAGRYAGEWTRSLQQAARARDHRFEFFGREFRYGAEVDWQADPVSGQRWPAAFHADVPVHGGNVGFGDVKYVWELSRQQYLIDLAKTYFIERRGEDLAEMLRLVRSWIAGNAYATGVNWACALEPAFRAWSWLWAYHLTADRLDPDVHLEWLAAFFDHGRFLARHLERSSSPYNHLIGEASALYALGLLFPEFQASGAWRRLGRSVLEDRLSQQFYTDGGSVEQSTFYHHATTGFYLLACVLGRTNGEEFNADVWAAVRRALDFSLHLTQPDGRIPEIGGADDGKPIRMEHLPFWDFRPYLAIGAVLFGRADYKAVARRFYEDALWMLGPAGLRAFDALPEAPTSDTAVLFRASGYAIDRSDWSEVADYVCFDVGEQAAGMRPDGVPNSMHGHADCLSVIVWLGGRRVLVDSGLYAYNCGGPWEAHFRETAAHNTARVDGRDQARHIRKMAWSHSYRPSIEDSFRDERQAWTLGSHDGFARGANGVTHRRAVWRRPGGYVTICDEFTGAGRHELEVNWQFAPGRLRLEGDAQAVYEDGVKVVWLGTTAWSTEIHCGGREPGEGWICSSLGVRTPAPRLTLRATMTASPTTVLTVLADTARSDVAVASAPGWLPSLRVSQRDGTDLIVARDVTRADGLETDGLMAVARLAHDGQIEEHRIGGTYVRVDRSIARLRRGELSSVR